MNKYIAYLIQIIILSAAGFSAHAFDPDDPPVWEYAKQCFDKIGLRDHNDLKGPFDCEQGTYLPTMMNGNIVDKGLCEGSDCPVSTFPDSMPLDHPSSDRKTHGCDFPAWLDAEHQCYGHNYLSLIIPKSNKNIRVTLLCRHKSKWSATKRNYDDIAMIAHNIKNGETCWFQSRLNNLANNPIRLNGTRVKSPTAVRSHLFWLRPKEVAKINCLQCHDSNPFVVSPWISQAFNKKLKFFDTGKGPYLNSTKPFATLWPTPKFIETNGHKLKTYNGKSGKQCTGCHKIPIAKGYFATTKRELSFQTHQRWIDWATIPVEKADNPLSEEDGITGSNKSYLKRNIYMPPISNSDLTGRFDRATWEAIYSNHIKHLKECAEFLAENPDNENSNCKFYKPKVRGKFHGLSK